MSRKMLLGLAVVLQWSAGAVFAWSTTTVNVLVTPVGVVSILALDGAEYNFGDLDVKSSSNSATGIRLQNDGSVGISVEKYLYTETSPWDISLSSTVTDGYDLFVGTAASGGRPTISDFEANSANTEITALGVGSKTNLTGALNGVQVVMDPGAEVYTWYMIRMPVDITSSAQKTLAVRFVASQN